VLQDAVIIGARFDVDTSGDSCRLAFYGRLLAALGEGSSGDLRKLQVYKVSRCSMPFPPGQLALIPPNGAIFLRDDG